MQKHLQLAQWVLKIRPRVCQVGQPDEPGTHHTIWATFLTELMRFSGTKLLI